MRRILLTLVTFLAIISGMCACGSAKPKSSDVIKDEMLSYIKEKYPEQNEKSEFIIMDIFNNEGKATAKVKTNIGYDAVFKIKYDGKKYSDNFCSHLFYSKYQEATDERIKKLVDDYRFGLFINSDITFPDICNEKMSVQEMMSGDLDFGKSSVVIFIGENSLNGISPEEMCNKVKDAMSDLTKNGISLTFRVLNDEGFKGTEESIKNYKTEDIIYEWPEPQIADEHVSNH